MIAKIFSTIIKNLQIFIVVWAVVIIANQLFIFGACFAPYCLIAALPHTSVISALLTYFYISNIDHDDKHQNDSKSAPSINLKNTLNDYDQNDEFTVPRCPKCGSTMVKRTARHGSFAGNEFWGCSDYPPCNGIINITK